MLKRYRKYLEDLDLNLLNMIESQKKFIKCKKGCDFCCTSAQCTLSEIEYINLMLGYNELPSNEKNTVRNQIFNLQKNENLKYYRCPFLIDGICTVYWYRPIICRTFGLIFKDMDKKIKVPFCYDNGLNYSDIENLEKIVKIKQTSKEQIPKVFNISRNVLRSSFYEIKYKIFFGEDRDLLDWLKDDIKFL